jgi:hypothetical protein
MREIKLQQYEMYHWETNESAGLIVTDSLRRKIQKDQLRNGGYREPGNYLYFLPVGHDPNRQNLHDVLRQVVQDMRPGQRQLQPGMRRFEVMYPEGDGA